MRADGVWMKDAMILLVTSVLAFTKFRREADMEVPMIRDLVNVSRKLVRVRCEEWGSRVDYIAALRAREMKRRNGVLMA